MADEPRSQTHYRGTRDEFLIDLDRLGPRLSTPVKVNGRELLLDGAMRLIASLPGDVMVSRKGTRITIEPSPFPDRAVERTDDPTDSDLVARLIQRQYEGDRESEQPRWWRRLLGKG